MKPAASHEIVGFIVLEPGSTAEPRRLNTSLLWLLKVGTEKSLAELEQAGHVYP